MKPRRAGPTSTRLPGPPGAVEEALLPGPIDAAPALTDRGAILLATAVVLGAVWSAPVPLLVAAVAGGSAVLWRRPMLVVVAGLLLAAGLGHRANSGLQPPRPGRFAGLATLVADPHETPWGSKVDVRVGSKRYELQADGGAAGTVARAMAGEQLTVEGRLRSPPPGAPWLKARHVVGRLDVSHAEFHSAGAAPFRAANRFRRLLTRGSEVMSEPARSLYGGFVVGDDRGQPPEIVDDFRASGLTHLLVVSGSNVAYLLALATPLTNRLALWQRWGLTVWIIAGFAVVTRFEPSIMRASAMAALAVTTSALGRPANARRVISLAVAGLVLIDPLLVHSVAFQLSVAASVGIITLASRIKAQLVGPLWLREAASVTVAAQVGVAPVLVPHFGGIPVVALLANVVAVPVAGLITMWGLPAGVLAGIAGPGLGRWLHLPTEVMIGWVAVTARVAAALPLGELNATTLAVVVALGGAAVWARESAKPAGLPRLLACSTLMVLATPAFALRSVPVLSEPWPGAELHRSGGASVLVVSRAVSPRTALEGLRRVGLRRIDVMVLPNAQPDLIRALRHRWSVSRVLTIADLDATTTLRVAALTVTVDPDPTPEEEPVTVLQPP